MSLISGLAVRVGMCDEKLAETQECYSSKGLPTTPADILAAALIRVGRLL